MAAPKKELGLTVSAPPVLLPPSSSSTSRPVPPDKHKFEKELSELTEQIEAKKAQQESSSVLSDVSKGFSERLLETQVMMDELDVEKKEILSEIKIIEERIRTLGSTFTKERDKANKISPSLKYKSEEMYEEQIKKLESQLQKNFTHLSSNDRRKLQQTIDTLKEAKVKLKDFLESRKTMDECRNEQDELRKRKDSLFQKSKNCRERVNSCRDDAERFRKEIQERKGQQKTRKAEQEAISREINELYQRRKKLNEDFRLKQNEYLTQMKGYSGEGGAKRGGGGKGGATSSNEKTIVERDHHKQIKHSTRVEVTRRDEEVSICLTLINYLTRLSTTTNRATSPSLLRTHQTQAPSASPDELRKVLSPPLGVTDNDDVVVIQRRKGEDEEEWIPAGSRDRNSRRKARRRKSFSGQKTFSKSLQHNATIFEQFNRLGLQPPITPADINKVSDQLRGLLIKYEAGREAESEAGDSGIMSSTGISEISDLTHMNDISLTSGEVTPNRPHPHSPSPPLQNESGPLDRSCDTIVN